MEHSHSPTHILWRHGIIATRLPIRQTKVRGLNAAPPTPLQGKCEEPWGLGAYRHEAEHQAHAQVPLSVHAKWWDLLCDRSLFCSHASSCALKQLIVEVINV